MNDFQDTVASYKESPRLLSQLCRTIFVVLQVTHLKDFWFKHFQNYEFENVFYQSADYNITGSLFHCSLFCNSFWINEVQPPVTFFAAPVCHFNLSLFITATGAAHLILEDINCSCTSPIHELYRLQDLFKGSLWYKKHIWLLSVSFFPFLSLQGTWIECMQRMVNKSNCVSISHWQ